MATPLTTPGADTGDPDVIDLTAPGAPAPAAPTTSVRIARDDNPFAAMNERERMRLFIRVLCELVAYGELDETDSAALPA
jgi:hypothetical protein